jgi:hypothetical protein
MEEDLRLHISDIVNKRIVWVVITQRTACVRLKEPGGNLAVEIFHISRSELRLQVAGDKTRVALIGANPKQLA